MLSQNQEHPTTQVARIKQTIEKVLHENKSDNFGFVSQSRFQT